MKTTYKRKQKQLKRLTITPAKSELSSLLYVDTPSHSHSKHFASQAQPDYHPG